MYEYPIITAIKRFLWENFLVYKKISRVFPNQDILKYNLIFRWLKWRAAAEKKTVQWTHYSWSKCGLFASSFTLNKMVGWF